MSTETGYEWKAEIERLDRTELLLHAARYLNSTLDLQELLEIILDLTCRAVNSQLSLVLVKGGKNDHIHFFTCEGAKKDLLLKPGEGIAGWVAQNLRPIIVNQVKDEPRFLSQLEVQLGTCVHNLIAVPVLRRGKLLGVLEALNHKDQKEFAAEDQEALFILAEQVAVALDNSILYRKVKEENLKKEILLEIDRQLGSSLELEEILETILSSLRKVVDCDAGGIFLVNKETQEIEEIEVSGYDPALRHDLNLKIGQGLIGYVAKTGESVIVPDVRKDSRYVNARQETLSEMVAPVTLGTEIIGVFNLESNQIQAFDEADLAQLRVFANQVALSIERARLHRSAIEQRKIGEELSIARKIQLSFLPKQDLIVSGFDIAGTNIPSEQVGGDYYDFITIVDNHIGIVIGDVSGKGIPASLIMASFRASLIAEIRNNYAIRTIFRKVNHLMYESLERENFVTAVYGVLDSKNRLFTYSNAGHNPPLLVHQDGKVDSLRQGGLALGILPDSLYQEKSIGLNRSDMLVFYTDGVTEALNPQREQFGLSRLTDLLVSNLSLSAKEILHSILDSVYRFTEGDRYDDLTIIVVKTL
jgi:sigma-B regulation protein RsbU (phosphoserine phosphatase)